jgi:hypothetical protein
LLAFGFEKVQVIFDLAYSNDFGSAISIEFEKKPTFASDKMEKPIRPYPIRAWPKH